jgi:hypothetical protein
MLVGCVTSNRSSNSPLSTTWKTENFDIKFVAGSRDQTGRSFSYYEINHSAAKPTLVIGSGHCLDGLNGATNRNPKKWTRVIEDPNGNALLIEEVSPPNDCGPVSNYLWVRLIPPGYLEGTYLRLPSKSRGSEGGVDYEYPKVNSLSGDVLTFRYGTEAAISRSIEKVEKADEPLAPG